MIPGSVPQAERGCILVSGGAGYIGSHAAYGLRRLGYLPVIIDNMSTGNAWAATFGILERGDIGDVAFVRGICERYQPQAAMHFAAFIEVGESVHNPSKYFENNRDKARRFFRTILESDVRAVVFSSTAAVYGEVASDAPITESMPIAPISPYGQSKWEAEVSLRELGQGGLRSVSLRYFNVAGAAPAQANLGEAHVPESHLIPRLILPLIDAPAKLLAATGLPAGFTIYGADYPTADGTAIRDYVHVMDVIDAHICALEYLLRGGATDIFNLGSGTGYSVAQIIAAARHVLHRPDFEPPIVARRAGDPAVLIAASTKAKDILGWSPTRSLSDIIGDAATWHRSTLYQESVLSKAGAQPHHGIER